MWVSDTEGISLCLRVPGRAGFVMHGPSAVVHGAEEWMEMGRPFSPADRELPIHQVTMRAISLLMVLHSSHCRSCRCCLLMLVLLLLLF